MHLLSGWMKHGWRHEWWNTVLQQCHYLHRLAGHQQDAHVLVFSDCSCNFQTCSHLEKRTLSSSSASSSRDAWQICSGTNVSHTCLWDKLVNHADGGRFYGSFHGFENRCSFISQKRSSHSSCCNLANELALGNIQSSKTVPIFWGTECFLDFNKD